MNYFIKECYFNAEISETLFSNNQIKEFAIYNVDKLIKHINTMGPSGMMFHKIDHLKIQYSKGTKTRAGNYIPTPTIIKNKNGVVNIKNKTDDMCIIWCLLAHKYYDTITHYKKSEVSSYKIF